MFPRSTDSYKLLTSASVCCLAVAFFSNMLFTISTNWYDYIGVTCSIANLTSSPETDHHSNYISIFRRDCLISFPLSRKLTRTFIKANLCSDQMRRPPAIRVQRHRILSTTTLAPLSFFSNQQTRCGRRKTIDTTNSTQPPTDGMFCVTALPQQRNNGGGLVGTSLSLECGGSLVLAFSNQTTSPSKLTLAEARVRYQRLDGESPLHPLFFFLHRDLMKGHNIKEIFSTLCQTTRPSRSNTFCVLPKQLNNAQYATYGLPSHPRN